MENNYFKDLSLLEDALNKTERIEKEDSILDVLGVTENDISKVLAYLLRKNPELLEQLISNYYFEERIINQDDFNVETERAIDDQKRIDIFLYGTFSNKEKFYVVIENKTWSREHDNQCALYAKWLESNYTDGHKYYLFLKPSSNITTPHCDKYKVITYTELYELLSGINNQYAAELNKTIKNNFLEVNMTELEQLLLKQGNFRKIRDCISKLDKELDYFFDNEVKNEIQSKFLDFRFQKEGQSRRFYYQKWWSDYQKENLKKQYYFYLEYILRDHDFLKLEVQAVIKRYCPDSLVDRLIEKDYSKLASSKSDSGNNRWYVLKTEKFVSEHTPLSDEWKKEFVEKVINLFAEYECFISNEVFPKFEKLLN